MTEPLREEKRSFGYYDIESVLGRGAMGMVYLARDRRIGRRVALKTVHVEEKFDDESEASEFYRRLQREAELCGSLQHPNIVTLYEPGYENEVIAWMATEYVDGESLRDRLRKRKPLAVDEALRIADGILRGLAYAHAKGIVHRDIKPANVLLTSAGEAKIADFGIARPSDSNLTAVGEMLGTPSYMSPEQVKCAAITGKSDLFSFGAMLYEMVTGLKAFGAPDVSGILRNVVEHTPKLANDVSGAVPPSLGKFIHRLIQKNPEERFPNAETALAELAKIREETLAAPEHVEEITPEHGVDTISSQPKRTSDPQTAPSSTSLVYDDVTPPISGSRSDSMLRRRVPLPLAAGIILVLLGGMAAGGVVLRNRHITTSGPSVQFTPAQIHEFEDKRTSMEAARAMYDNGRYQEAFDAYGEYLERYPYATAAIEGRAAAARALQEAKAASAKVSVTGDRPKKTAPAKKEEPKKSIWRRIFRG
jgi:serine/threonine-protein kinase